MGKFVCYIEGSLYWTLQFNKYSKNNQNVRYIEVFQDLGIQMSQYRATYIATALETQEQTNKTA